MRICSLQPGATEIAYALGLEDQLYGVTSKCDYPTQARKKPVVVRIIFDSQHLSSGEISRTIAQQRGNQPHHCSAAGKSAAPLLSSLAKAKKYMW